VSRIPPAGSFMCLANSGTPPFAHEAIYPRDSRVAKCLSSADPSRFAYLPINWRSPQLRSKSLRNHDRPIDAARIHNCPEGLLSTR
jgi:hypothetical protein